MSVLNVYAECTCLYCSCWPGTLDQELNLYNVLKSYNHVASTKIFGSCDKSSVIVIMIILLSMYRAEKGRRIGRIGGGGFGSGPSPPPMGGGG